MNKIQIITSFILFLISLSIDAQHMELSELGLSFDIPQGWKGGEQEDYILLGHETIPGLMIISQNTAKNTASLKKSSMEPINEAGLFLAPDGDFVVVSDSRVEGNYTGTYQGEAVKAFMIGLSNSEGVGITILILTSSNIFGDNHITEANKLAKTVQFFKPKDTDNTHFWKNRIEESQLKYMHTSRGSDYSGGYSGTSDVVIINLCTNGQFSYYANANASFDSSGGFGSANNTAANQGIYTIYSKGNETYLELQFDDGNANSYELVVSSEEHTLLNGSRYFITQLEGCN